MSSWSRAGRASGLRTKMNSWFFNPETMSILGPIRGTGLNGPSLVKRLSGWRFITGKTKTNALKGPATDPTILVCNRENRAGCSRIVPGYFFSDQFSPKTFFKSSVDLLAGLFRMAASSWARVEKIPSRDLSRV